MGDGSLSSSNPGQILYDYKSIRKANTFLENVDKVTFSSDAVKANYVAQAKAIRAYKYFLMIGGMVVCLLLVLIQVRTRLKWNAIRNKRYAII